MSVSILDLAPFIPSDRALAQSALPDKVIALTARAAQLSGRLTPATRETLRRHMAVINSYYSNLIEGNRTPPHEIRAAQAGNYSSDPARRDLQRESLAHIEVQHWIRASAPDLNRLYQPDFIRALHGEFYSRIPETLWQVKNTDGSVIDNVVPGQWRTRDVSVGRHIPPGHAMVADLMARFCEVYHPQQFSGERKLIAVMSAHHRLAWIHPFLDGNGRVIRLLTDAALDAIGLDGAGVWCLSRGLARSAESYKGQLAQADSPRRGDYDGRGALSEAGLLQFCEYMLDIALDQVNYMVDLLDLASMRERIIRYVQARNDWRVPGCDEGLKPVAANLIFSAFVQGELDRGTALELCGMPERSARRLLSQLKADGLLSESSNKSPLRWEIPVHAEPWYFPNLVPGVV